MARELSDENMLNFTCMLYQFPSETRCEMQKELGAQSTDHNILLKMDLQQMELIFMMEQTMRIVDYSVNCIAKLFNTGLVNSDYQ